MEVIEVFDFILHLLSCICIFALFYWLMCVFLLEKNKAWSKRILAVIVPAITLQQINNFENPLLNTGTTFILSLLMVLSLFDAKWTTKIVIAMAIPALELSCEFLNVAIQSVIENVAIWKITNHTVSSTSSSFISILMFYVVTLCVRHLVFKKKRALNSPYYRPSIRIVALPALSILLFYYLLTLSYVTAIESWLQSLNVMVMFSILIVNIIILIADERSYKAYEDNASYLEMIMESTMNERLIAQQADSIDRLENMAHDYNKKIAALYRIVAEQYGFDETLNQYFTNAKISAKEYKRRYDFGNRALTAIVNDYADRFEKSNIDFAVAVEYSDFDFLKFADLCTILSNALENSYAATKKVTTIEDKYVKLKITKRHHILLIYVENGIAPEQIRYENGEYLSSKTAEFKRHGIGLKNIKRKIDDYSGSMVTSHNEKTFKLECTFPIPCES